MTDLAQVAPSLADTIVEDSPYHPLPMLVDSIVEGMSNEVFATTCHEADEGSFRRITGCNSWDIDQLWIRACPGTFRGSAEAWTMDVIIGVDSDCGKTDYDLRIAGSCTLGVTRFTSVAVN